MTAKTVVIIMVLLIIVMVSMVIAMLEVRVAVVMVVVIVIMPDNSQRHSPQNILAVIPAFNVHLKCFSLLSSCL